MSKLHHSGPLMLSTHERETTAHLHLLWSWNSTIWRLEHSRIYLFRGIFKGNSPNWVFSTGILNFPFQWWELTGLTCECHFWHGEFQLSEYWTAFAVSLIKGKHRENSNFSLTIILKILVNKQVQMKQVKESYSSGALFSYYWVRFPFQRRVYKDLPRGESQGVVVNSNSHSRSLARRFTQLT